MLQFILQQSQWTGSRGWDTLEEQLQGAIDLLPVDEKPLTEFLIELLSWRRSPSTFVCHTNVGCLIIYVVSVKAPTRMTNELLIGKTSGRRLWVSLAETFVARKFASLVETSLPDKFGFGGSPWKLWKDLRV